MAWSDFFKSYKPDVGDVTVVSASVTPVGVTFSEQMNGWLEGLEIFENSSSHVLSAKVFSRLNIINDKIREVVALLDDYGVDTSTQYDLEHIVKSYVPDAVTIFNQLPDVDQVAGGEADRLLLEQCENIERNVVGLGESLRERVQRQMRTQTNFVDLRFTD